MSSNIKKIKLKNREGSALAFVLIIFLILSFLVASILHLVNTNLLQAKRQQDRLEAYYLSYSGAEMAFASLMANNKENLNKLRNGTLNPRTFNIDYANGKISGESKISTDENFENWIEILSTGKLNKNDLTYTRKLLFDPSNPIDMIWIDD